MVPPMFPLLPPSGYERKGSFGPLTGASGIAYLLTGRVLCPTGSASGSRVVFADPVGGPLSASAGPLLWPSISYSSRSSPVCFETIVRPPVAFVKPGSVSFEEVVQYRHVGD